MNWLLHNAHLVWHGLKDIWLFLSSQTPANWYHFGEWLASIPLYMIVLNWTKKHHQLKHLEDLAKADLAKVIVIAGSAISLLGWALDASQPFIQFIPKQFGEVVSIATALYLASKGKKFVTTFNFLSKISGGSKQLKAAAATPDVTPGESTAPDASTGGILQ